MENSLKAIMIGAGVVITMIVVSIGFLLMRQGQSTAQNSISRLGQLNVEMVESQYTMYDGMEIRGDELVNVLNRNKKENIGIHVKTKKNTGGTWYIHSVTVTSDVGSNVTKVNTPISNTMKETHNEYINPNGMFLGKIIRDVNGTIVAMIFDQQ